MAHLRKRPSKDGPRWEATWRDPDGRARTKTFAKRAAADQWLTKVGNDLATGTYVDPAAGRQTFGEYAARWKAAQIHRPTTTAQVESYLRQHLLPHFGDRPLASIRPSEVQAWVKGRSQVLAASSVETLFRYLSAILRAAVADRVIPSNPAAGVKLPRVNAAPIVPIGGDVVFALVDGVPDRYRALVVTAAGTGLRQGELFGLRLSAVDFLRRSLRVERALSLVSGEPFLGPPKTQASFRTVPLPDVVLESLSGHLTAFPVNPNGFVFTDHRGRPIRRNRFSETWRASVRQAGLPPVHFHELRHYYASLLIRAGESVKVVQSRLGHASASETLDTYSHLWPDSEDRTRQAVDGLLTRPPATAGLPLRGVST